MKKYNYIPFSPCILLVACLLFSCKKSQNTSPSPNEIPYYNDPSFTPIWLSQSNIDKDSLHIISSFSLTNQDGEIITNRTFDNKIYIADFFFTACSGICPKMTKNMADIQDRFIDNEHVLFISHSVTPTADSISVLKAYAEEKGVISGKWHLVTGERSAIYSLGRNDYFVEEDMGLTKDSTDFLHTENFILIDKEKHIRGIYNGLNKASLAHLEKDVRLLLQEKQ